MPADKVNILDVSIDNLSKRELLEALEAGGMVVTPNIDHLVKLQSDEEFRRAYAIATYRVCDSQVLAWLFKLKTNSFKGKISGSDFFPFYYQHHKDNDDIEIFLLGAAAGVALTAQQKINAKVGRDIVVEAHSPSFNFLSDNAESLDIVKRINRSGATVLAIGVGAPKQEKWLLRYGHLLTNVRVMLAIGATIDFEAGHVQRAPSWISELGLEWLYRLMSEPKRLWKRYLIDDMTFFWLILRRKVTYQIDRRRIGRRRKRHFSDLFSRR
ncbi:MAG: WecB/TagA/CpsF family glycosyltransferase [Cyanobacteria bacterium J06554_3]